MSSSISYIPPSSVDPSNNTTSLESVVLNTQPKKEMFSLSEKERLEILNDPAKVKTYTYIPTFALSPEEQEKANQRSTIGKVASFACRIGSYAKNFIKGAYIETTDRTYKQLKDSTYSNFTKGFIAHTKAISRLFGWTLYGASVAGAAILPLTFGVMGMFGGGLAGLTQGEPEEAAKGGYYVGAAVGSLMASAFTTAGAAIGSVFIDYSGDLDDIKKAHPDEWVKAKMTGAALIVGLYSSALAMGVAKDMTTISLASDGDWAGAIVNHEFGLTGLLVMDAYRK